MIRHIRLNWQTSLLEDKIGGATSNLAFECCFTDSPLGGGIDPFSRGSLFSPKCDGSGGSLHRGQAREAVAGAWDLSVHRRRGNKASYQGIHPSPFDSLPVLATVSSDKLTTHVPNTQTAKRLKSKPQDALEGVVLSVCGNINLTAIFKYFF